MHAKQNLVKNYDAKFAIDTMRICPKKSKKVHLLQDFRLLVQIRFQKEAGTKMHKCLIEHLCIVFQMKFIHLINTL